MTLTMLRLRQTLVIVAIAAIGLAATASEALASHFRYGTITWQVENPLQPNVVKIHFDSVWRWSFPYNQFVGGANLCTPAYLAALPPGTATGAGSCPALGTTVLLGGGVAGTIVIKNSAGVVIQTIASVPATVTTVNTTEDWFASVYDATLTLPVGDGNYLVEFRNQARLSTLLGGNANAEFVVTSRITVRVPPAQINRPPVAASVPIIKVTRNQPWSFQYPGSDPDGDLITFRLATFAESGLPSAAPNVPSGAGAFSLSSSGLATWTPTQNGLWAVQAVVTDSVGAYTVVDSLFNVQDAVGQPPTVNITRINNVNEPNPTEAKSIIALLSQPTTFEVKAIDPEGTSVLLQVTGKPAGASMTPTLPSTAVGVTSTFSFTPTVAAVGTYIMTFSAIDGDGRQSSNSVTLEVVNATVAAPTITSILASPGTTAFGAPVILSARAQSTGPNGSEAPPGRVQFLLDGVLVGTGDLSPIGATESEGQFAYNAGGIGPHTVTARYVGAAIDGVYYQSSTSNLTASFTVTGASSTTTSLVSTPNPTQVSVQSTTFTLTVTPAAGATLAPTGTVTIKEGAATVAGGLTLTNGVATFTTSALTVGAHVLTATYVPSTTPGYGYTASTSAPYTHTVTPKRNTTVVVTSTPNPSTWPASVTFTATVTPTFGVTVPTGSVTFRNGPPPSGLLLGTGTLTPVGGGSVAAKATITSNQFNASSATVLNEIFATYSGDPTFEINTGSITQTVNKANPPVTITATPLTSFYGQPVTFNVSVDPPGNGTRQLTLLEGSTVLGGPASGTGGGGNPVATFVLSNLSAGPHTITGRAELPVDPAIAQNLEVGTKNINVTVLAAATSLSALTVQAIGAVGDSLTVSTTLTRTATPAGVLAGKVIVFKLTGPNPATTSTLVTVTTDAGGAASATFTPALKGTYSVAAEFAGDPAGLLASTSNTASVSVYQKTSLTLSAPASATAGSAVALSATLKTVAGGAVIAGQPVSFSFGGVLPAQSVNTDGNGVAILIVTFPAEAVVTAQASFLNPDAFFADHAGALVAEATGVQVVVVKAVTTLSALAAPASGLVGAPLSVSTTLSRVDSLSIGIVNVVFTLTQPGGTTVTATATTNAAGVASVTFPAMTSRGVHTVSANFAGSQALVASSSNTASVPVYQKTLLTLAAPATATAGSAAVVSATLTTVPGTAVVTGQPVTFSFGGVVPQQTVDTDLNGVATLAVMFPAGGTATVSASFLNAAGFFADHTGATVAEAASAAVVVAKAATSLALTAPDFGLVGDALTVGATLTRTVAPIGGAGGVSVAFTLIGPNGVVTATALTDATGLVSVTFPALAARGVHTVTATFAGDSTLAGSDADSASVSVYQRTVLTLAPVTATAGGTVEVTARLTTPGGAPVIDQPVSFSFGGLAAAQSADTDDNGVARVTVTFPAAGPVTVNASFLHEAAFFVDSNGGVPPLPEVDTTSFDVSYAVTNLAALTAPLSGLVDDTITVSTTLTRTVLPAGPVSGQSVVFTLTGPSGPVTVTGTTNGAGFVSVIFPGLTVRGLHTVTARFDGSAALAAAASDIAAVTVYQRTVLTLAPVTATAGGTAEVTARLTTPGGAPVIDQAVSFSFGGLVPAQSADTDENGVARVTVTFPAAGTVLTQASFLNGADFFVDSNGGVPPLPEVDTTSFDVSYAATNLAALTMPAFRLVDDSLTVSTTLTRIAAPAGPVSGQSVVFTLTGPNGAVTATALTDATGLVSVTFPALAVRGVHTVTATFAGDSTLAGSDADSASVSVYQRTVLTLAPVTATAGGTVEVTARLTTPGGAPVMGQAVSFSFGGLAPAQSADTDDNGVARVTVTFPAAGTVLAQASFLNGAAFFVDSNGGVPPLPEVDSQSFEVSYAATNLAALTMPAFRLVDDSLTVSTTLTRTVAPIGGAGGVSVAFTLTSPNGVVTATALTDATGLVSVIFPALAARGVHTVTATFAGDSTLAGSDADSASVSVYQRTVLTLAPVTATAGGTVEVTARLTTPGGAPVMGQPVSFSFGGLVPAQSADTDDNGVARVTVTFPAAGTVLAQASFLNGAAFFVDSNGGVPPLPEVDTTSFDVSYAATNLAALTMPAFRLVDDSLTVSTTLTRIAAPAGPVSGQSVVFTLTGPSGPVTATGTTDGAGFVSVIFPGLTVRGVHTVTAAFAGDSALAGSDADSSSVLVYQRTVLTLAPVTATAGGTVEVTARLTTPGGAPVMGQPVSFSFGGLVPAQSADTDDNGVARVTVTFPAAGPVTVNASFLHEAAFFVDSNGGVPPLPEVDTTSFDVSYAGTNLAALTMPAFRLVDDSLTVSTTLTRIVAPAGPVSDHSVVFTLTGPNGPVTATGVTNSAGLATVTFPLPARGTYTVAASFATDSVLLASSSNTASVAVYQRTSLALPPVTATAGTALAVTATLTGTPGGAAVSGQLVNFTFTGAGAPGPQSATTNAGGVATATVTFTKSGIFTVDASFANGGGFFTNAGGAVPAAATTANTSATVADPTPPVITPTVTGVFGTNGWYTSNVNVSWAVADPESGVTSPTGCGPTTVTTDGASISFTCSASSAGGPSSQTVTFKRDTTAPTVTAPANITTTTTGTTPKVVTYSGQTATDALSAVTAACSPVSGTAFVVGTTTVTCSATDNAGNTGSATFTVTVNPTGSTTVGPGQTVTFNNGDVGGNVTMNGGTLILANGSQVGGNIQGNGNVTISGGSTVDGNLQIGNGNINLSGGSTVDGNLQLTGSGSVTIGAGTVDGNLQITGGGRFTITPGAVIDGNFQVSNQPVGGLLSSVCGAVLNNNAQFSNNGAPINIGSTPGCAGNAIDGNLQINNNTAQVRVFSNQVDGNLQCSGNTLIAGASNTANNKQGQCSGF